MRLPQIATLTLIVTSALASSQVSADVVLPSIFSEHMVLQRSPATPVWGQAEPGEKITLTLTPQLTQTTTAGTDGRWQINLDLSDATRLPAGPHQLTIKGNNTLTLSDILIGEVWLASGQSNMARAMSASGAKDEIANSTNNQIRFFTATRKATPAPLPDVSGKWISAAPGTTPGFSAVAYYFARQLQAELGIPFGIIHSSWGGTPVEAWTSQSALAANAELAPQALKHIEDSAQFPALKAAWLASLKPWLTATQREDRPTPAAQLAAYTTQPATANSDGWTSVKLPGKLPGERILWIRRDITVPKSSAGKSLTIDIDEIVGIDTVYLDGKKIGGRTLDTFDGDGRGRLNARRQYRVPASDVTAGTHILAIRIYAPLGDSGINAGYFTAGTQSLSGDWSLKTEYTFPALAPITRASKPAPLKAPLRPWNVPASLYNGMIDALIPYALRGYLWYQGENDAGNPHRYRTSFPQLINDWRTRWSGSGLATDADKPLSFYWCQLPNYQAKTDDPNASVGWAGIRESQTLTLKLPRTGQAVLIDVGEASDVHPQSKREAGARLAALALANDYGQTNLISTGPTYDRMTIENSAIRIHFKPSTSPLVAQPVPAEYLSKSVPQRITRPLKRNSPDSQLEGFMIRGTASNDKWHWANATIDPATNTILVSSPQVPQPQAVRYAWFSNPTCNLYNAAGFPACPFRTDTE